MSNVKYYIKFSKGTGDHKYKAKIYNYATDKKIKTVQFGNISYEHFKDSTGKGLWSHLDHNDEERRKLYRERHGKIMSKLKNGQKVPSYQIPLTPAWFSWHFLW